MSKGIRFNYVEMQNAAKDIYDIKEKYMNAGNKLVSDLEESTKNWEGKAKEKFIQLVDGDINEYVTTKIPQAIESIAKLLEENAKSMKQADQEIADAIPSSLSEK